MSRQHKRKTGPEAGDRPVEIPMTDLGWSEDVDERPQRRPRADDIHAAGTPGGGTASGGLAGTNFGDGDPDNADAEASGGLSNAPLHLADLANDHFEQEVAAGLLQNEQALLGAIEVAMDRVEDGTYGKCIRCGKEIPEERLKAVPYASRCVACET